MGRQRDTQGESRGRRGRDGREAVLGRTAEECRGCPRTAEDARGLPRTAEDGRGLLSLQKLEEPGKDSTRDLRRNQPCRYLGCRLVASTGVNEYTAVGSHSECAAS